MSSSVIAPSWLDDLLSEGKSSLLESEDSSPEDMVSLDSESPDYTLTPETVLVVRS